MADLLLVDDHPMMLSGVRSFVEAHGHRVIASAHDPEGAIRMLRTFRPDVVVLDFHMADGGGLTILEHIQKQQRNIPAICFTVGIDGEDFLEALRLGVNALVLKNNEPESLLNCIEAVMRGEDWFDDAMVDVLIAHQKRSAGEGALGEDLTVALSDREREIADHVAKGARNREIAERFGITEGTVKAHLNRIFRKLGVRSRSELMLLVLGRADARD